MGHGHNQDMEDTRSSVLDSVTTEGPRNVSAHESYSVDSSLDDLWRCRVVEGNTASCVRVFVSPSFTHDAT